MKKKLKTRYRVLTRLDVDILKFLWKWKLSSTLVLKYALAPKRSFWKFYKIVRNLFNEGYVRETSNSASDVVFWTLTKRGFQYLNDGSMALSQDRFKPQALLHDYWAMVLQLGDFVFHVPEGTEIVSEQDLNARALVDLPKWLPNSKEHIPDGMTKTNVEGKPMVLAFEVELSMKEEARYEEMILFLDRNERIDFTFWLCANGKIVEKITEQILKNRRRSPTAHNFLLISSFQKQGWSTPFIWGELVGRTIADVLQPAGQHGVNSQVTDGQYRSMKLYSEKAKSPRGFKSLASSVDPLGIATP